MYLPTQQTVTRLLLIFLMVNVSLVSGKGQFLQIGSTVDEQLRSQQLLTKFDPSVSFCVRPLNLNNSGLPGAYKLIDSVNPVTATVWHLDKKKRSSVVLLPVSLVQQFNSHHPYGWNDGAMISAKGYQVLGSAGIYASIGPLEMQLQPEWVYAVNTNYEISPLYGSANNKTLMQLLPGQSTISLSAFSLSAGVSTANLFWGPGRHSSLLMSNNAPGFLHGFFRSQKPIKTPIGSLEWQLIGGKLGFDNNYSYETYHLRKVSFEFNRYLSAFVISYQPKWVPGLFLGMTRSLQRYRRDIDLSGSSFLNKYIPVIVKPFQKQNALFDDTMYTDQLASFFLRWSMLKAKAEFYIEYGFNDYGLNVRDYLMAPTHSAAYIVGAKKIIPLVNSAYLDLGVEVTQMSQTPEYIVRDAGNWYTHGQIQEGYVHNNQILGAGAGIGANVQTVTGTWVKGMKKIGIILERVERDPQKHINKWIDYGIGFKPQWQRGNMILSGVIQFISSSQYAWQKDINRFNLHTRLSVQYQF